jgi:hypothetical protein
VPLVKVEVAFGDTLIEDHSRLSWQAAPSAGMLSLLSGRLAHYKKLTRQNRNDDVDFTRLMDLALRGKGDCTKCVEETTARYLGIGIANLIEGSSSRNDNSRWSNRACMAEIATDLKAPVEASICRGFPSTRIISSTLGTQPAVMGALNLVLASKFASVS